MDTGAAISSRLQAAGKDPRRRPGSRAREVAPVSLMPRDIIVVGASAGGVEALRSLLAKGGVHTEAVETADG